MKKNIRSLSHLQSTKALLSVSLIGLLTLGGCQTTGGLHSAESDKSIGYPIQSNSPSQTVIIHPEDDSKFPETANQTDNSHSSDHNQDQSYPDMARPNLPQSHHDSQTNTDLDQSENETPVYTAEPGNTVDNVNKPNAEQPDTIYVIKPPIVDAKTARQELLERARQNSNQKTQSTHSIQDGNNIPAFRRLMDTGVKQLRQGQLSAAQSTFTRAQRLGPQSSAVYFYLGQVALKQNQALKAEAMARRGLVVAQSSARKRALWQLILQSAQMQGNQKVINEAKTALSR